MSAWCFTNDYLYGQHQQLYHCSCTSQFILSVLSLNVFNWICQWLWCTEWTHEDLYHTFAWQLKSWCPFASSLLCSPQPCDRLVTCPHCAYCARGPVHPGRSSSPLWPWHPFHQNCTMQTVNFKEIIYFLLSWHVSQINTNALLVTHV